MTLKEVQDMFSDAEQADLEHGVKWMNEEASKKFAAEFPRLSKALDVLYELEQIDPVIKMEVDA